jgi:phage shock protein E
MERYALAAVLIGLAIFMMWRAGAGKTSPEQARELVEAGAALIDVRTPAEFASGHIEGARNIPVSEIGARADEVGDKDAPVVVYCRSGARSANATSALERAGFTQVHDLGAMSRWK